MAHEPPPWRSPQPPASPPPSAPWTAPPPPPTPPPAWTPRPPKRRRLRLWIYSLVGAVVAIVGLGVASGTIWIQKVKPPLDAANDYLRDISHGNYEAAFDQLCAAERTDGSPRSLARTVDSITFSLREYEVLPFDVHIDGSHATVKVNLNPDSAGADRFVRMRLRDIDGKWRPCGGEFGFVTS